MTDSKDALRHVLRQIRKALSAGQRAEEEDTLQRRLLAHLRLKTHPSVAMYLALGSELDLRADDPLWHGVATVHVPVMGTDTMGFAPAVAPWTKSALGIREPRDGRRRPAAELEAIFLPLLGCDQEGTRLGQGGGWYDRTLQATGEQRPVCIGVGFDCQLVDTLPRETHDQTLDAYISARGARAFTDKGTQWLTGY